MAAYQELQERTEAIENVNHEGGKFIREAKGHDARINTYVETLQGIHGPNFSVQLKRTMPPPEAGESTVFLFQFPKVNNTGHVIVRRELDELNRRFSHLASIILERRNVLQVLIQNWKRQQQVWCSGRTFDDITYTITFPREFYILQQRLQLGQS